MGREKSLPGMRVRRLGLMVVVLAGSAMGGTAWSQTVDRNGGWLRAIAGVNDRPIREPQALAADAPRHPESDESRNPRRWSPEERRQLRNDIHQAGRDVYGGTPRKRD